MLDNQIFTWYNITISKGGKLTYRGGMFVRLTDKQRKLVEKNHNLIFHVANRFGFDLDKYYDVLAIGLCKASVKYDPTKGKFSTIAVHIMKQEVYLEYRKEGRRPLEVHVLEYIPEASEEFDYKWIEESNLSDTEKKIIYLKCLGHTQSEIAEEIGISQVHVSRMLKGIRSKIMIEG